MKKNLLLVLGLGVTFGASAQVGIKNRILTPAPAKSIITDPSFGAYHDFSNPQKSKTNGGFTAKAALDTVFFDNFSAGSPDWTIENLDNTSTDVTGTDFGWAYTTSGRNTGAGGGFLPTTMNSVSKGRHLEVINGKLTSGTTSTSKVDVTYTVTSPSIPLTTNEVSLSFYQVGGKFNDIQETYISVDGGNFVLVASNSAKQAQVAYPNAEKIDVNLAGFIPSGSTSIKVQFKWSCGAPTSNNMYWFSLGWGVDDVLIYENPSDDLRNLGSELYSDGPLRYTKIPTSQKQTVYVENVLLNNGINAINDAKSIMRLTAPSGVTYDTVNVSALASKAIDTLVHEITLTDEGVYTVSGLKGIYGGVDEIPSNDSTGYTYSFEYGGTVYAAEDGVIDSYDYENTNQDYDIGNYFGITEDVVATGVDVYFYAGSSTKSRQGTEVFAAIRKDEQGFGIISQTPMFEMKGGENGWKTLVFEEPVALTNNTFYVVTVGCFGSGSTSGQDLVVGLSGSSPTGQSLVNTVGSNGRNWYLASGTPMVRLNLTPGLVSTKNLNESVKVNIYPNPAKDKAIVDYNTAFAGDVTISVVDLSGRTVYTNTFANQTAGNNKVELNTADFNAGVYQVVINANSATITKKLVIK